MNFRESPSSHYLQQTVLLLLSSDHNRMTDAMTCDGAFGVAPRQDQCCIPDLLHFIVQNVAFKTWYTKNHMISIQNRSRRKK
ncbi:unnamed protein product [Oreochromis niloticus]|nr:unnamed protein product [Mustela putorius furo]